MQLMPCLQSYMTENMSYFGSLISKELQRDTADLHYELLTTNADLVLRLSALWIGYGIGKTCKDFPIHHISQIKCLDLNIVKCCPSSMLSQGAI